MTEEGIETRTIVDKIVSGYPGRDQDVIAIIQDIQDEFNHVPKEALLEVVEKMDIPLGQVYNIATFYNAFSLEPKGECPISVCTGTACHVKGASQIIEILKQELGIGVDETTEDGKFSLEEVRCLGCCGLAPVITIGNDVHGNIKVTQVKRLLKNY